MTHADQTIHERDIVIAGAGGIGLALALSISLFCPRLHITIVEPTDGSYLLNDERSYAVALDCVKMLRKLNVWQNLEPYIQPINEIKIFDSDIDEAIRINLLEFKKPKSPIGYMVKTKYLYEALYTAIQKLNIELIHNTKIISFNQNEIKLSNGLIFNSKLLIAADGNKSPLRTMAGIKSSISDYKQKAIVCTINHEYENNGLAVQYFFKNGPFAILPLINKQVSIVWSETQEIADKILDLAPEKFMVELKKRFGNFLGSISIASPIQSFPLSLILPHSFIAPRFLLIGDAAHRVHPICGQGFNLGLRDCAVAAQIIVDASNLGLDIGDLNILEKYQRARRANIIAMAFTSHMLNKTFSNDIAAVRTIRDIALSGTNKLLNLKTYFIDQSNGTSNKGIKLLNGQDL